MIAHTTTTAIITTKSYPNRWGRLYGPLDCSQFTQLFSYLIIYKKQPTHFDWLFNKQALKRESPTFFLLSSLSGFHLQGAPLGLLLYLSKVAVLSILFLYIFFFSFLSINKPFKSISNSGTHEKLVNHRYSSPRGREWAQWPTPKMHNGNW